MTFLKSTFKKQFKIKTFKFLNINYEVVLITSRNLCASLLVISFQVQIPSIFVVDPKLYLLIFFNKILYKYKNKILYIDKIEEKFYIFQIYSRNKPKNSLEQKKCYAQKRILIACVIFVACSQKILIWIALIILRYGKNIYLYNLKQKKIY